MSRLRSHQCSPTPQLLCMWLTFTPCSRELSMVERRCFPQMPRGLPPPPQSASSLFFSGRTTLQCNSPSRAPHSLWDRGKARFLLKPHLCPAFPSGFPVPFPYLAAVKSVTNTYLKNKKKNILFWTFTQV